MIVKEGLLTKKPYYADYVNHMLRFYCRNMNIENFRNQCDERNWWACYNVIECLPEDERQIVINVFTERCENMLTAVQDTAATTGLPVSRVWAVLNAASAKVAKEARLIS